jgi:hypothetical protein
MWPSAVYAAAMNSLGESKMSDCRASGEQVPEQFVFPNQVFCPFHANGRWIPVRRMLTYDRHREGRVPDEDMIAAYPPDGQAYYAKRFYDLMQQH